MQGRQGGARQGQNMSILFLPEVVRLVAGSDAHEEQLQAVLTMYVEDDSYVEKTERGLTSTPGQKADE